MEALREVAAARRQRVGLGRALDAFRDRHEPERVRDLHDGPDEQRARPAEDVAHERAVDLQQVDRELLEVRERRVAGAEVVDGEPHAEVAQAPQPDRRRGRVLHERALGDLEDQALRLEPAAVEQRLDPVGQAGSSSWRGATFTLIDGAAAAPTRVDPARGLLARGLEHVLADLVDEAGLLRERDERERAERPALGVLPANERFDAVMRPDCSS